MDKQHGIKLNWQWALGTLVISLGAIGTFESLPAEARSNSFDDPVKLTQSDFSSGTSLDRADLLIASHHPRHHQYRRGSIRHRNINRRRGFRLRFGRQHRPRFNQHHHIYRSRNHQRGRRNSGFYYDRYGVNRSRRHF